MTVALGRLGVACVLTLCQFGCNAAGMTDPAMNDEVVRSAAEPNPTVPAACTIASYCLDIDLPPLTATACCTPVSSCGYILPELDPETVELFPDAKEIAATLTQGDPNGRCAQDSFFFGPQEGLAEERYEAEGSADILVAPGCASYHIANFTLVGCCLPGNICGLSTHLNWDTFAVLANDPDAPFSRPECVPAEVLNQQFRDSTLRSVARAIGGGTCNYAEIDARQPQRL